MALMGSMVFGLTHIFAVESDRNIMHRHNTCVQDCLIHVNLVENCSWVSFTPEIPILEHFQRSFS